MERKSLLDIIMESDLLVVLLVPSITDCVTGVTSPIAMMELTPVMLMTLFNASPVCDQLSQTFPSWRKSPLTREVLSVLSLTSKEIKNVPIAQLNFKIAPADVSMLKLVTLMVTSNAIIARG